MTRRVILESPYAGDTKANTDYARRCLRDSLARGEAPFASHLLYTQVLNDDSPDDRQQGIDAGLVWMGMAEAVVVYCDLGISAGMERGMDRAAILNIPMEMRRLNPK